jgi:hypothetical protein
MFLGSKVRRVRRADNLTAVCGMTVYRQCGSLNISQPYRTPRPVKGTTLLYFYFDLYGLYGTLQYEVNFIIEISYVTTREVLSLRSCNNSWITVSYLPLYAP